MTVDVCGSCLAAYHECEGDWCVCRCQPEPNVKVNATTASAFDFKPSRWGLTIAFACIALFVGAGVLPGVLLRLHEANQKLTQCSTVLSEARTYANRVAYGYASPSDWTGWTDVTLGTTYSAGTIRITTDSDASTAIGDTNIGVFGMAGTNTPVVVYDTDTTGAIPIEGQ